MISLPFLVLFFLPLSLLVFLNLPRPNEGLPALHSASSRSTAYKEVADLKVFEGVKGLVMLLSAIPIDHQFPVPPSLLRSSIPRLPPRCSPPPCLRGPARPPVLRR